MKNTKKWIVALAVACGVAGGAAEAFACGNGLCTVDLATNTTKTWAGRNATWGSWNSKGDQFANINGRSRYACLYGSTNFRGTTYALPRGGEFLGYRNFGRSNQWYTNRADCY